jgi:hypothetical protein
LSRLAVHVSITCLLCVPATPQKKASRSSSGIDEQGNVYVSSEDGGRITMASGDHCVEVSQALDFQTMGCLVSRGLNGQGFVPQGQVEVYTKGGHKLVFEPGGAIRGWRFWKQGRQVAISFDTQDGGIGGALYDAKSGKLIEKIQEPTNPGRLPQWAKSRSQIDDESVPMSPALAAQRTKWMAKVMRQIDTIKPGMHRADLATLFVGDGGLNFFGPSDRYVFKECRLIKIDVRFKSSAATPAESTFRPNDVIEFVSKPYLEYPFAD